MKKTGGCPGSFFWLGNSPDMNPIEHVWALLKVDIGKLEKKTKK